MSDLVKLWIEALRSGKYQQGRGALRIADRLCCLGVLCEVAGIKPVQIAPHTFYAGEWSTVPPDLDRALEENHLDKNVLIALNDSDRLSFEEIADYIERKTNEST